MTGMMILTAGIVMVILSAFLFIASMVYRQTAGRKIREKLMRDYE